jgi:hypothetical protein
VCYRLFVAAKRKLEPSGKSSSAARSSSLPSARSSKESLPTHLSRSFDSVGGKSQCWETMLSVKDLQRSLICGCKPNHGVNASPVPGVRWPK